MSKKRKQGDTRSGWSRRRRPVSMQTLLQQWQAILNKGGFQPPFQPQYGTA